MRYPAPEPSPVDRAYRLAYWLGYRAARAWWWLRHPEHQGAMIAVWLDGRILAVRQSYNPRLTWPGGGVGRGEDPAHAARRELREEVGLAVQADQLTLARQVTCEYDHRRDHVCIFELHLAAPPALKLDGREITGASFLLPAEMLAAGVPPFIHDYLRDRASPKPADTRPGMA